MAGEDNLTPFTGADDPRRHNGRPKGVPNRKSILRWILFDADVDEMGIIKNKPDWWGKIKPKNLYEVMTLAMATKAASGDHNAYKALNKAMGDRLEIDAQATLITVEFIKPDAGKKTPTDSK